MYTARARWGLPWSAGDGQMSVQGLVGVGHGDCGAGSNLSHVAEGIGL